MKATVFSSFGQIDSSHFLSCISRACRVQVQSTIPFSLKNRGRISNRPSGCWKVIS